MIFTNIIKCDINGNIIDDKPKIWFIPKYKFNDVFLPFHKKTKKDYIMYDYIFKVELDCIYLSLIILMDSSNDKSFIETLIGLYVLLIL